MGSPEPTSIDGRVVRVDDRFALDLSIVVGERALERHVEDADCAALADAAVLIARVEAGVSEATPASVEPPPPDPLVPDIAPADDPMPAPAAPPTTPAAVRSDVDPIPAPAATPSRPASVAAEVEVEGSAGLIVGPLPDVSGTFGTGVDLALRWRPEQRVRLALQLRGAATLPVRSEFDRPTGERGSARFWAATGTLAAGVTMRLAARVGAEAVAGVTVGGLQGSAREIDAPRGDSVPIGGPMVALAAWGTFSRLRVGARAEGGVDTFQSPFGVGGIGRVHVPARGWSVFRSFFGSE